MKDKPDFKAIGKEKLIARGEHPSRVDNPIYGEELEVGEYVGEKIWNDFVVPERKSHQIELSNYAYQIDRAKRDRDNAEAESMRLKNDLLDALDLKEGKGPTALSMLSAERDRLKAELDTAKELLWSIHRSLYIGPDLRDKEIMLHYIGVASVIKEEIEGFLKDKK